MRFMFKKHILDNSYIPDGCFDWSEAEGFIFPKADSLDPHSSISSSDMGPIEGERDDSNMMDVNICNLNTKYRLNMNRAQAHMKHASNSLRGKGKKTYIIPKSMICIGQYQYMPLNKHDINIDAK